MNGFFLLSLAQLVSVLTALALVKIHSIWFSVTELGLLALIFTLTNVVSQLITGPITLIIRRKFLDLENENNYIYINEIICGFLISVLICFISASFVISYLTQGHKIEFIIGLGIAFINAIFTLVISIYNVTRQRLKYLKYTSMSLLARVLAAVILMTLTIDLHNYLAYLLGFYVIFSIIIIKNFLKDFDLFLKLFGLTKVLNMAWNVRPLYLTTIPFLAIQISDKWLLEAWGYDELLGQYAVYQLLGFTPVIVLSGVVLKYLYPLYVKGENIEMKKHFSRTCACTSILAVFLTVLSFTFSDLIILVFASPSVVSEILNLGTFFISGILFSFAMLYQQQLELAKLYRSMAITRAVGGLISLIMLSTVLYVEEHRFIDEVFALTMLVFFILSFNAVSRIKGLSFD